MKCTPFLLLLCITASALSPSPAWSGLTCAFRASAALRIDFPELDPSNTGTVTAAMTSPTTQGEEAGDCKNGTPETMTIQVQGGSNRVLTFGANTIAYSITNLPKTLAKPGNNTWVNWMSGVGGQIQWSAFRDAPAGTYTDTVTIEITP